MPEAENFIKTRQKFLAAIRKPFSDYLHIGSGKNPVGPLSAALIYEFRTSQF